ncbi:MAG TPA: hypothetical protein VF598_11610 [Hymenobacter sp.]
MLLHQAEFALIGTMRTLATTLLQQVIVAGEVAEVFLLGVAEAAAAAVAPVTDTEAAAAVLVAGEMAVVVAR